MVLFVIVIGICLISITGSGCKSRSQNQANDSVSEELKQYRKKLTIKNILSLVENPKNKSIAQKCGLDSILEETDEYGGYWVYYGYDVEKGEKIDNSYNFKALSEHSTYFQHYNGECIDYLLYFKSKEDADYFLNEAKKQGFKKKDDSYTNGKWEMAFTQNDNWSCCQISSPVEYDEYEEYEVATGSSNSNNEMSESNKQKTLEYMRELQQIANEIDNVYNQYVRLVSSGNLDPMAHGNLEIKATQNISKLSRQAESIWDKLIALARETGGDVRALQEEKKKYLGDAYKMQLSLHSVGMNTNY